MDLVHTFKVFQHCRQSSRGIPTDMTANLDAVSSLPSQITRHQKKTGHACFFLFSSLSSISNFSFSKGVFFLSWCDSPLVGLGLLLIHENFCGFEITHNDAPHSVGLLWTSEQLVAVTSTWKHTTLTTNIHVTGGIRTKDLSRQAAVDLRLRPRGHWDRLSKGVTN